MTPPHRQPRRLDSPRPIGRLMVSGSGGRRLRPDRDKNTASELQFPAKNRPAAAGTTQSAGAPTDAATLPLRKRPLTRRDGTHGGNHGAERRQSRGRAATITAQSGSPGDDNHGARRRTVSVTRRRRRRHGAGDAPGDFHSV